MRMNFTRMARACCAAVLCSLLGAGGAAAEPLLTQGIGTSNCGRLAGDIKPGEGLTNPVNLMAYSWAQGYISAANIARRHGPARREPGAQSAADLLQGQP
jgi:hypothetical protein